MSCTQCDGIEAQFGDAAARKQLRRFRRRGPDKTTRLLIESIRTALGGSSASTVALLDIGGGVGAIHHQLLEGAVSRATHVDASAAYLAAAREETARRGHEGRVDFVHGDFVSESDKIPNADVVTLDRVICCYHDMPRLVDRSARKTGRLYGAVYPRGTWGMRIGLGVINAWLRLQRSEFRVFFHRPADIDAVLRSAGLDRRLVRRTLGWEIVVYERTDWHRFSWPTVALAFADVVIFVTNPLKNAASSLLDRGVS
jgi:SAM-dependent methyltransferase